MIIQQLMTLFVTTILFTITLFTNQKYYFITTKTLFFTTITLFHYNKKIDLEYYNILLFILNTLFWFS